MAYASFNLLLCSAKSCSARRHTCELVLLVSSMNIVGVLLCSSCPQAADASQHAPYACRTDGAATVQKAAAGKVEH
eukprot:98194-Amphidinium_carterae.1